MASAGTKSFSCFYICYGLHYAYACCIFYIFLHILFLSYFILFKYLILIIGSPVFAYLSEKTEAIIENREYKFNLKQLLPGAKRGMRLAIRNAGWQTVYMIGLILLSLFPV